MADLPKPATLHDVAHLAGVSYQTVSRVVNGNPNVAPRTRSRVLKAIRELGYRPNKAARSLVTGRSHVLQVIALNLYWGEPIAAFHRAAKDMGFQLGVSVLNRQDSLDELRDLLDDLRAQLVDGVLLITPQLSWTQEELTEICRGLPFVLMGVDPGPLVPSVVIDQRYGMQQVMQHLLDLGHRRIAEASGPLDLYDGRARHETYLAFAQAHGLDPGPWAEGDFGVRSGYEVTCHLLDQGASFTALVCGGDHMAIGALRALAERGLRVPDDVSLTGFEDDQAAAFLCPPLTTVRQDYRALARQAVEVLVSRINDPYSPPHCRTLYPQLIVRQSTRRL